MESRRDAQMGYRFKTCSYSKKSDHASVADHARSKHRQSPLRMREKYQGDELIVRRRRRWNGE